MPLPLLKKSPSTPKSSLGNKKSTTTSAEPPCSINKRCVDVLPTSSASSSCQDDNRNPIEILEKVLRKATDDERKKVVELLEVLEKTDNITGFINRLTTSSSSIRTPPPPPPPSSSLPPISSCAPPPPPLPGMPPISKTAPPPPPLMNMKSGGPPPPLRLDLVKGAAAGQKSTMRGTPPPPLPPKPSFLNEQGVSSPGTSSSLKPAVTYRKEKMTVLVRWPNSMQTPQADSVFNGFLYVEFNEEERSKIQEVFEEAPLKLHRSDYGGSLGRMFGKPSKVATSTSEINSISTGNSSSSQILNSAKALAFEILLKNLKLDFNGLIQKLNSNNTEDLEVDLMVTLKNNFPDEDELEQFLDVDYRSLTHASYQFCWHIARNKHFRLQVELFIMKENVPAEIGKFQSQIELLLDGCRLARGECVQMLLRKCLQYGNFLNEGTMFGEVSSFQLSYLLTLLQLKGKGQHSSVRLVDLVITFCDLPIAQIVEIQTKMVDIRSLNLKDLEDAIAQIQRSIRKLEDQMRTSNEEKLIATYQPFMDKTKEKLQKVQNGISDLKVQEAELREYLCAGEMSLQAIFEVLEHGMKVVADSIKQAASKAKVQRATSMSSLKFFKK